MKTYSKKQLNALARLEVGKLRKRSSAQERVRLSHWEIHITSDGAQLIVYVFTAKGLIARSVTLYRRA